MATVPNTERHIGLIGATGIGVGAIVGGGILALSGVAVANTGPGALLAFAANGLIAIITALSFAELSSSYPRSGGTYVFAKRVLSVGAAFSVGWVVWFASIVAAALYAMGFAVFFVSALTGLAEVSGWQIGWLNTPPALQAIAILATIGCTAVVVRSTSGSGNLVNILKVLAFVVLIGAGFWAWSATDPPVAQRLTPMFPFGATGFLQAMGYTFIAMQGFDLIAAAAGEVRDPRRVLPRAMLLSLAIALVIYLPLLLVVFVVGVPEGTSSIEFAQLYPETLLAEAARAFLGPTGFWIIVIAGVLSMLSALLANLFGAARIAQAMSVDRTLPPILERVHPQLGTPVPAFLVTAGIIIVLLVVLGDVSAAGAAASLIFLITFALAHVLCLVSRRRNPNHSGFRVPFFPALPILGALACAALAIFQGVAVPTAGRIAGGWLIVGGLVYLRLLAPRARVFDAAQESSDPDMLELRGRSPLVLVPVANPDNAGVMALLAACVSPPRVGRVLLLHILPPAALTGEVEAAADSASRAASVVQRSMQAAILAGVRAEALATISEDPWEEMVRVARVHRCASVLVGMSVLSDAAIRGRMEQLASSVGRSLVIVRAKPEWLPETTHRVLVPISGGTTSNALRARLLSTLRHRAASDLSVVYLCVLPMETTEAQCERSRRAYLEAVRDEVPAPSEVQIVLSDDVGAAIVEAASECDLLVLGLSRISRRRRIFGEITRRVIADTTCAALVISQDRQR